MRIGGSRAIEDSFSVDRAEISKRVAQRPAFLQGRGQGSRLALHTASAHRIRKTQLGMGVGGFLARFGLTRNAPALRGSSKLETPYPEAAGRIDDRDGLDTCGFGNVVRNDCPYQLDGGGLGQQYRSHLVKRGARRTEGFL